MIPTNDPDRVIYGCLNTPVGRDALLGFTRNFDGTGHIAVDSALTGGRYYVHVWTDAGHFRAFVSPDTITRFGSPAHLVGYLTGADIYAMDADDFAEYAAACGGPEAAIKAITDAILAGKPLAGACRPSPQVDGPLPKGGPEMN